MKQPCFRHRGILTAALLTIFLGLVCNGFAQAPAANAKSAPRYNPATETTVTGTVEAVTQLTSTRGWGGTHLSLQTESGTLDVHLGPTWYLQQHNMTFAKGDKVTVLGSQAGNVLLAREVSNGEKKLTLRDDLGFPLWSRGRR